MCDEHWGGGEGEGVYTPNKQLIFIYYRDMLKKG